MVGKGSNSSTSWHGYLEEWREFQLRCFSSRLSSSVVSCYMGPASNMEAWQAWRWRWWTFLLQIRWEWDSHWGKKEMWCQNKFGWSSDTAGWFIKNHYTFNWAMLITILNKQINDNYLKILDVIVNMFVWNLQEINCR